MSRDHSDTPTPRHPDTSPSAKLTVYRPNMRHEQGWVESWAAMARNTWSARELMWQLFKRDFFAQYKKSFLGYTWAFITPIIGVLSWVFLQMTGMLKPGDVGIPYPAYVLVGTSMWGLFVGFYNSAHTTLGSGRALIQQVNYPHEALLFKQTASQLANFLISFVVNIIVLLAFRVVPSWGILLFPLVALPLFFLGAAMGLLVCMISIVAVDLDRIISIGMRFLMYTTPLIYSNRVPNELVQTVIKWNPLTYLVCSCRDVIIYGHLYEQAVGPYFLCAGVSFLLFLVSLRLFYVSEHKLIERMI